MSGNLSSRADVPGIGKYAACPACGAALLPKVGTGAAVAWLFLCRICDDPAGCSKCQPSGGSGLCKSCLGVG